MKRLAGLALVILGSMAGAAPSAAQQIATLVQFTNVWKYDQSGLELGTAWRTNDYDDSAWPSGRGLLGFEDIIQPYTVHAPIHTPLIISTTVTSYYFRTTFQFSGETNGLSLFATNLMDDGCVVYLNGFEAGRVRVSQNQNATTLAQGPSIEGQLDVLNLNNVTRLRQGTNLLAVEVHQAATTSVDVMWGMKLMAIQQFPLTITEQPQDRTETVGNSATFNVGVTGGLAFYRWQKDGVNIAGATGAAYTLTNLQLSMSGEYRVIVTNAINSVTSSPARLVVLADRTGPRLLSATVRSTPQTSQTNQIIITFNEILRSPLISSSSTNISNYRITRCNSSDDVVITNASHVGRQVLLRVGGSNWVMDGCYVLTVNNVSDSGGNRIAPDSQVAIAWPLHLNLTVDDYAWSFHASAVFDPGIFDEDWTSTNYAGGPWWAEGNGIFYGGPPTPFLCRGSFQTPTGFQPEPVLFRTTFLWPTNLGSTAQLEPAFIVDDGVVLYLNGVEIWRTNAPAAGTRLSATSRSTSTISFPTCVTNISFAVTNLLPGTNWLAVGVVQPVNDSASDLVFGLRLSATVLVSDPIQDSPLPTLNLAPNGSSALRLWWTGGGYALESATNLTDNIASYPVGPWQQVTNMSNPYTNSLTAPARFFRLKK